jgi:hypothetical protein
MNNFSCKKDLYTQKLYYVGSMGVWLSQIYGQLLLTKYFVTEDRIGKPNLQPGPLELKTLPVYCVV